MTYCTSTLQQSFLVGFSLAQLPHIQLSSASVTLPPLRCDYEFCGTTGGLCALDFFFFSRYQRPPSALHKAQFTSIPRKGRNDAEEGWEKDRDVCSVTPLTLLTISSQNQGSGQFPAPGLSACDTERGEVTRRDLRDLTYTPLKTEEKLCSGNTYIARFRKHILNITGSNLGFPVTSFHLTATKLAIFPLSLFVFCSTANGPPSLARETLASPALRTAASPPQRPTAPEARQNLTGMTFNGTRGHIQVGCHTSDAAAPFRLPQETEVT